MNLKNNHISIIYFILYCSLLFGFYLNEDLTLGYKIDHFIHLEIIARFNNNFLSALLNFDNQELNFTTAHSPFFYIVFLIAKKIFLNDDFFLRLFNLHISLAIPYIFYLTLKLKYKIKKNDLRILIPGLFFLSPYFRSGSIWIGSENISLIFLFGSFYFYFAFTTNKNKNFYSIFFNIIFLSIAAYLRPIYALFSIYFFFSLYKDLVNIKKIYQYIFINIALSMPAFYYIFILDINFIAIHVSEPLSISRFVNQFAIIISILFYYSIPFFIFNYNQLKDKIYNTKNYLILSIYIITLLIFFSYSLNYGGGIFYKISTQFFYSNYFFYLFSAIGFIFFKIILIDKSKLEKKYNDLILFFTIIFLEVDTTIYHETYDLIFYMIFIIILRNNFFSEFVKNLDKKRLIFLYSFSSIFYLMTAAKSIS